MWKNLRTLMAILWAHGKEHKHEVKEKSIDILTLRRKLAEVEQKLLNVKQESSVTSTELIKVRTELRDAIEIGSEFKPFSGTFTQNIVCHNIYLLFLITLTTVGLSHLRLLGEIILYRAIIL